MLQRKKMNRNMSIKKNVKAYRREKEIKDKNEYKTSFFDHEKCMKKCDKNAVKVYRRR